MRTTLSIPHKQSKIEIQFDLDLTKNVHNEIKAHLEIGKLYEEEISRFLIRTLDEGDCFVDIGAHMGFFSLLAAQLVGESGTVFSFEPEITNHQDLTNHVHLNKIQNIQCLNQALFSKKSSQTFYMNRDNDGGHALWDIRKQTANQKSQDSIQMQKIELEPLDTVAQQHNIQNIKIMKIDTEGCEKHILQGGLNTIQSQKIPFIICEINEFALHQLKSSQYELRAFMSEIGYETYILPSDGSFPIHAPLDIKFVSKYIFNILFTKPEYLVKYWTDGINVMEYNAIYKMKQ